MSMVSAVMEVGDGMAVGLTPLNFIAELEQPKKNGCTSQELAPLVYSQVSSTSEGEWSAVTAKFSSTGRANWTGADESGAVMPIERKFRLASKNIWRPVGVYAFPNLSRRVKVAARSPQETALARERPRQAPATTCMESLAAFELD